MAAKAVCSMCRAEYDDEESVELVRTWQKDGYAPCPNLSCRGQLEIVEEKADAVKDATPA